MLHLQVPDALFVANGRSIKELEQETQVECSLMFFQKGQLTSGQAAEMAGMNRVDFLALAGSRKIPLLDLDEQEWNQEKKVLFGE